MSRPPLVLVTFVSDDIVAALESGGRHQSSDGDGESLRWFLKELGRPSSESFTCLTAYLGGVPQDSPLWLYARGSGAALVLRNERVLPEIELISEHDLQKLAMKARRERHDGQLLRELAKHVYAPDAPEATEQLVRRAASLAGPLGHVELRIPRAITMADVLRVIRR